MIAELRPYNDYRSDGPTWCSRIPKHWENVRNGRLFQERKQTGFEELPVLEVSLRTGIRVRDMEDGARKQVMSDFAKYKRARKNDIAYNMMRMWQGAVGVVPCDGLVSPAYVVATPLGTANCRYFYHLFRTSDYIFQIDAFSRGIVKDRNRLYWDAFKQMPSLCPPPDEQELIVRFLDWASVRLGKAITAKRKVIGLLEEQKQAIIHRAVTHGLDDSVPLKPSGLDWLGDVPCYLRMVPLKAVCHIQSGVTLGKHYGNEQLSEYAYLRVANVQAGRLDLNKVLRLRLPKRDAQRSLLQYGDLLMTEGGDPDKLGRGCIWRNEIEPCIHQNHIFAVRPNPDKVVADFLEITLATRYARNYFIRTAKQTTNLASTNRTTIGAFRLLLPNTLGEQHAIVEAIRQKLKPVDASITRFTQEILLLQEYRTRLIADVVTGKLDVREFAGTLPADIAEEAAELASSELGDDEFSDTDDELADELAGEPA